MTGRATGPSALLHLLQIAVDELVFRAFVEQRDSDERDCAELYPQQHGFFEPWDGSYSTWACRLRQLSRLLQLWPVGPWRQVFSSVVHTSAGGLVGVAAGE